MNESKREREGDKERECKGKEEKERKREKQVRQEGVKNKERVADIKIHVAMSDGCSERNVADRLTLGCKLSVAVFCCRLSTCCFSTS